MTGFLTGWGELGLAFGLFVTSHMIPARPLARAWLLRRMGKTAYLVAYTGLSILAFGWLILAAGRAPYLPLWDPAAWQIWVTNVSMPFVFLLLAYGIPAPNPLSIASRNDAAYDPDHPGIVGCTRHPVLWAATLWASAHVPPNGDLAHVIVFCLFAALGVFGALIVDIRRTDSSVEQSVCDYPPTRHLCRSSRFLPGDGSPRREISIIFVCLPQSFFISAF